MPLRKLAAEQRNLEINIEHHERREDPDRNNTGDDQRQDIIVKVASKKGLGRTSGN